MISTIRVYFFAVVETGTERLSKFPDYRAKQ